MQIGGAVAVAVAVAAFMAHAFSYRPLLNSQQMKIVTIPPLLPPPPPHSATKYTIWKNRKGGMKTPGHPVRNPQHRNFRRLAPEPRGSIEISETILTIMYSKNNPSLFHQFFQQQKKRRDQNKTHHTSFLGGRLRIGCAR